MRWIAGQVPMNSGTSTGTAPPARRASRLRTMILRSSTSNGFDRYSAAPARSDSRACCGVVWAVMMMKGQSMLRRRACSSTSRPLPSGSLRSHMTRSNDPSERRRVPAPTESAVATS